MGTSSVSSVACHACWCSTVQPPPPPSSRRRQRSDTIVLVQHTAIISHRTKNVTVATSPPMNEAPCSNGHTWTHQWGDDWTPDVGTPCDCGKKKWGIPLTVTREH